MGLSGPLPARAPAEVKELVLKQVEEAVAEGFSQAWVCSLWGVSDDRVHRWRARQRATGTLVADRGDSPESITEIPQLAPGRCGLVAA